MASPHFLSRRHLFLLPAGILPISRTYAQATPTAPPTPDVSGHMQVAAVLPELPGALSDAHLSRYTLDPDAIIPSGAVEGSAVILIRSGSVTLATDTPVTYRRAGESIPATPIQTAPEGIDMSAGDGALITDASRMTIANTGRDVAHIGFLLISSSMDNVPNAREPEMAGVLKVGMGAASIPFRSGPAITIVEQVVMQSGRSGYSATLRGVEIGSVEQGEARVLCRAGETRVLPRPFTDLGVMDVEAGSTIDLATGDGYTSRDGSLVWRSTGEEPLVLLRAQVIPIPTAG